MKDIVPFRFLTSFFLSCVVSISASAQIKFNEVCSSNSSLIEDQDGDTRDWIELYNISASAVSLSGFYLTDSKNDTTKWQFQSGSIAANGHFLIFASGKDRRNSSPPHTSFKLAQSGEKIWLYDGSKSLIDSMTLPYISTDMSYGLFPDGDSYRAFFAIPTPATTNNNSITTDHLIAYQPILSISSGQFSDKFELEISTAEANGVIRYTTDGSEPSATDAIYSQAIEIGGTSVITARTFAPGLLPSTAAIGNYIFSDDRTLPKICLSTHPGYFFDNDTGIYVFGPNASPEFPYYGANFWSDTEIPVNVQWIDTYGRIGFDQKLGVQIHGGSVSRTRPMRSLRLEADDKYGKDEIEYSLFSTKIQKKNKRFILRNSGSDYLKTIFRDGFIHNTFILNQLHVDAVCYNPVEVYLNGAFWGIHNVREKVDRYYGKYNYGVDEDNVDILEEQDLVMEGSSVHFNAMEAQVLALDLSDNANFAIADSLFDVLNMADYYIAQTYINNLDWPYNNLKYWRERKVGAKWRYVIFDLDATLGGVSFAPVEFDALNRALGSFGDTNRHVVLFRKLLENQDYFHYYINRYCDLVNSCFSARSFSEAAERAAKRIRTVVPMHFERWSPELNDWEEQVDVVKQYVNKRPPFAIHYLQQFYGLDKQAWVDLNVYPPHAGRIDLNSITIRDFPFNGVYFEDVPIKVGVTANQGFTFSHWESNRGDLNLNTEDQHFHPEDGDQLTAIFTGNSTFNSLQVYPNPSSQNVSVRFVIPQKQEVGIFLVDLNGQTKHQLFSGVLPAGSHQKELSIPTELEGVFLLTVLTESQRHTQKLVLLKSD